MLFKCKLINPEPIPTPSFIRLSHSGPLPICPHHARTRYQTTRDSLHVPEPTEIIQISQSYTCLPCLVHSFSWKPPKRLLATAAFFLCTWPTSFSCAAPHDMACYLLLGTVSSKLSSQWQLSPDPLFLYLKTFINKLYFKQGSRQYFFWILKGYYLSDHTDRTALPWMILIIIQTCSRWLVAGFIFRRRLQHYLPFHKLFWIMWFYALPTYFLPLSLVIVAEVMQYDIWG